MSDIQPEANPASPDVESLNGSFSTNGSDPGATTNAIDGGAPDLSFLDDLAKAMRTTAAAQQARDAELTDQRRQSHLDAIRAREALEAESLRELAKEDVKGIDAWSDGEIKRIKLERERRIASRREQLQVRLEEHRMVIGSEVEAVEAAITAYRSETERFFDRLGSQTDPVEIARQAGTRPPFPDLDKIGPQEAPAPAVAAYQAPAYEPTAYEPPAYSMTVTSVPAAPAETAETSEPNDIATDHVHGIAETETETADAPEADAETVEPTGEAVAEGSDQVVGEAPTDQGEPIGVMDPDAGQDAADIPWGAPVEAVGEEAQAADPIDEAIVAVENGAEGQGESEEPVSVGAEARVVMPRTTGTAGSWLRWPNSSADRSDPSR